MTAFDQRNQRVETQYNIINPLPPAEARTRADLGILLNNVKETWITGVLEASVDENNVFDLGLKHRPNLVDNPWKNTRGRPDQTPQILPPEKTIKDIFDKSKRLLLILGDPGSGKTTTLLQLARSLIAEVDDTFTKPVPVIFNLSTWGNTQQPLEDWLVSELASKYYAANLGKRWLKDRRILPLLDGLDEVREENQSACVEEINRLVRDFGVPGLVVCSRIQEYEALNVRLAFSGAINLQPLSFKQIDEYFDRADDKLVSLQTTLQKDEALKRLAQSPLMLNIMSLAYQDISVEALNDPDLDSDDDRRRYLFDIYIAQMINREGMERAYDDDQIKHHLSWLAQNMQRHNQEVFLIEGLQPSWLYKRRWRWIYTLVSRLIFGLSVGLTFVLAFGSSEGLIEGLIGGISIGLIDIWRFERLGEQKKLSTSRQIAINFVGVGLIGWLISVLIETLTFVLSGVWVDMLALILLVGLVVGLIGGLRGSPQYLVNDIQTIETLRWTWRKALEGMLIGGLIGVLIFALSLVLSFGLSELSFEDLRIGLFFALVFGLVGAIFNGLNRGIVEGKTLPNQGIRSSAKNMISGGLVVGLAVGLAVGLVSVFAYTSELRGALISGVRIGLLCSLIGALWFGGLDIIRHYTLRLILIIQGYTPPNYIHFLNHTTDLIFLQKAGGSYRFIHRLIQKHFANLSKSQID